MEGFAGGARNGGGRGESGEDVLGGEGEGDPGPVEGGLVAIQFGEELLGVGCCYVGEGDGMEVMEEGGGEGVGYFWGGEGGGC